MLRLKMYFESDGTYWAGNNAVCKRKRHASVDSWEIRARCLTAAIIANMLAFGNHFSLNEEDFLFGEHALGGVEAVNAYS